MIAGFLRGTLVVFWGVWNAYSQATTSLRGAVSDSQGLALPTATFSVNGEQTARAESDAIGFDVSKLLAMRSESERFGLHQMFSTANKNPPGPDQAVKQTRITAETSVGPTLRTGRSTGLVKVRSLSPPCSGPDPILINPNVWRGLPRWHRRRIERLDYQVSIVAY